MNIPIDDNIRILVVGDLMLDEYVRGNTDRISPEAPVQVISVMQEDYTLGGAGNVVNNLAALGAEVFTAGVIGDRVHGERLLEKFRDLGLETSGIVRETGRFTTRKTRILAAHQHVLRIDRETRKNISPQTLEQLARFVGEKIPESDAVIISDYGKGLITRPFLSRIITMAKEQGKPIIADPKGLDFSKYAGITLVTPNQKEAALASGIEITDRSDILRAGEKLLGSTGIKNLLITCGKDGMVLLEREKEPFMISAKARQVFDVSGAGDTVAALMGLAMGSGLSLREGAALANTGAGIVVGKVGTATVSREEIAWAMSASPDNSQMKHKSLPELSWIARELKQSGKKIVLTNGCFDLIHAGHILLFSASKQFGDILIVAIDDDASVRTVKGPGRPVICAEERVRILSALSSVDYVATFSSGELEGLLETVQPDVLTKGSNYASEEVFGREIVERAGGRVSLIPVAGNISSSGIINSIRNTAS